MIELNTLNDYLCDLLNCAAYDDYCPNGLQVAGKSTIKKIVTGVTACQALIDAAIAEKADAILVHHGYFWKGEDPCLTGMKGQRIKTLLQADVNLLAYHLPLDGHATLGNNAQLAQRLGLQNLTPIPAQDNNPPIVFKGELPTACCGEDFAKVIAKALDRDPLFIPGRDGPVKTIGLCTGGAQDYMVQAVPHGIDAFLTGEVSERTFHEAKELGVHFFAAGHHATERYGIQALGEHLAEKFPIKHQFIDIPNPV